MKHKCKFDKNLIVEPLIDSNGFAYCKDCYVRLSDDEIEPGTLKVINERYRSKWR